MSQFVYFTKLRAWNKIPSITEIRVKLQPLAQKKNAVVLWWPLMSHVPASQKKHNEKVGHT